MRSLNKIYLYLAILLLLQPDPGEGRGRGRSWGKAGEGIGRLSVAIFRDPWYAIGFILGLSSLCLCCYKVCSDDDESEAGSVHGSREGLQTGDVQLEKVTTEDSTKHADDAALPYPKSRNLEDSDANKGEYDECDTRQMLPKADASTYPFPTTGASLNVVENNQANTNFGSHDYSFYRPPAPMESQMNQGIQNSNIQGDSPSVNDLPYQANFSGTDNIVTPDAERSAYSAGGFSGFQSFGFNIGQDYSSNQETTNLPGSYSCQPTDTMDSYQYPQPFVDQTTNLLSKYTTEESSSPFTAPYPGVDSSGIESHQQPYPSCTDPLLQPGSAFAYSSNLESHDATSAGGWTSQTAHQASKDFSALHPPAYEGKN